MVWSFSPAWEAVELTLWRGGRHDGAEVPFPPSSIPAYIEQSMKLFVCLLLQPPEGRTKGFVYFFPGSEG